VPIVKTDGFVTVPVVDTDVLLAVVGLDVEDDEEDEELDILVLKRKFRLVSSRNQEECQEGK
jgi:hypothetical protein